MLATPHLLIADDDRDFRETLRSIFAPRGFWTQLAADGEEAWQIVCTSEVHVVLIDLHMPRLSGLETIGRIKAYRSQIPCILISGGIDQRVQVGGVFSILTKPVNRTDVLDSVNLALRTAYPERFWGVGVEG